MSMSARPARTQSRLAAALLAVALLGACAHYQNAPLSPEDHARDFAARSLKDEGLRRFLEASPAKSAGPWPPPRWDFPMLTQAALYYHPDLDTARAQRAVTEAGEITAAQRPNPTVSFSPTRVADPAGGLAPWIWGWSFNIPIETAGKRGYRMAQAWQLSESARMNLAVAAWQVRSRLRNNLLNLYAARQTERLRKQQELDQTGLVRLMEQRQEAGEISPFEVTLIRLALEQTLLALREAQRQEAESLAQVASAVGVPVAALQGVEIGFDGLLDPPAPEVLGEASIRRLGLLGRADVLAALADYQASQSALQLEIARQYPDINLGPGYQWDQGDHKITLGISMVLPLLHQNQGAIAVAEAQRKAAATRFDALQARIVGELDRTLAGARAARAKLATADSLVQHQDQQIKSAQALYEAGETDHLALLSVRLEQATTALARLDALVRAQQALGLLEDAIQRPLDGTSLPAVLADAQPIRSREKP